MTNPLKWGPRQVKAKIAAQETLNTSQTSSLGSLAEDLSAVTEGSILPDDVVEVTNDGLGSYQPFDRTELTNNVLPGE